MSHIYTCHVTNTQASALLFNLCVISLIYTHQWVMSHIHKYECNKYTGLSAVIQPVCHITHTHTHIWVMSHIYTYECNKYTGLSAVIQPVRHRSISPLFPAALRQRWCVNESWNENESCHTYQQANHDTHMMLWVMSHIYTLAIIAFMYCLDVFTRLTWTQHDYPYLYLCI